MFELLIATVVIAIIGAPITAVMYSASAQQARAQQRTAADRLAAAQIEYVRGINYDSIGLVGGNPPGVLPVAAQVQTISGGQVDLLTQVSYVDNGLVSGGVRTYADYKKVTVTVSGHVSHVQLSQVVTYVSSSGSAPAGGLDWVTIKANLIDYALTAALSGAGVSITAPSAQARTDLTDFTGQALFPALSAGTFQLALAPGFPYTILKEDLPLATKTLAAGSGVWTTTLRVYRAATINLTLLNAAGQPYNGSATVWYSSNPDRGGVKSAAVTFSNGLATLTNIYSELLVPNVTYTFAAYVASGSLYAPAVAQLVPSGYPTVLNSNYTLQLAAYPTTTTLNVTVKKKSTGTGVGSGATVVVTGGPASVVMSATTNSSSIASVTVPKAATPLYTISATSGTLTATVTAAVNSTPTPVTVLVQ